jgi:hypothetical protein
VKVGRYFATEHQIVQRSHRLFDRSVRIPIVDLIQVDLRTRHTFASTPKSTMEQKNERRAYVVHLQSFERVVDGLKQVFA